MSARFLVPCTVRVSCRPEDLSAHVELDGEPELGPGDEVQVHGEPLVVAPGEVRVERRVATVRRANVLRRAWVRLFGDVDCLSLIEVSFSERRL